MDERLQKALEFSNYNLTIVNQKNNIKNRVNQLKIVHYDGGVFVADQLLITFLKTMIDLEHEEFVVIDSKENPINIKKPKTFLEEVVSTYVTATNTYQTEWDKIKKLRSIDKIMEMS